MNAVNALIMKEDAKDVFGCGIYEVSDVLAVLEFKASGIFFSLKDGKDTKDALKKFSTLMRNSKNIIQVLKPVI